MLFAEFDWAMNPILWDFGLISVRWYGFCFLASVVTAIKLLEPRFQKAGRNPEDATSLLIHVAVGIVIGSRLIHCLAYEPGTYLRDPLRILKVWEGGLASHGAALGTIVASLWWARDWGYPIFNWFSERLPNPVANGFAVIFGENQPRDKIGFFELADMVIPAMTVGMIYIRLGNLFNSEIIGRQTDMPWGFRFFATLPTRIPPKLNLNSGWSLIVMAAIAAFVASFFQNRSDPRMEKWDEQYFDEKVWLFPWHVFLAVFLALRVFYEFYLGVPKETLQLGTPPLRHPSQVYELLLGIGFLIFMAKLCWTDRKVKYHKSGWYFFVFYNLYFMARFFVEYFKDFQSDFAENIQHANEIPWITMGQILSLPFLVIGIPILLYLWPAPKDENGEPLPDLIMHPELASEPASSTAENAGNAGTAVTAEKAVEDPKPANTEPESEQATDADAKPVAQPATSNKKKNNKKKKKKKKKR